MSFRVDRVSFLLDNCEPVWIKEWLVKLPYVPSQPPKKSDVIHHTYVKSHLAKKKMRQNWVGSSHQYAASDNAVETALKVDRETETVTTTLVVEDVEVQDAQSEQLTNELPAASCMLESSCYLKETEVNPTLDFIVYMKDEGGEDSVQC